MESERVRQIHTLREPHRAQYGHLINQAIGFYEDPTRYPVQQLIDLFALQREMMGAEDDLEREARMHTFRDGVPLSGRQPARGDSLYGEPRIHL